MEPPEGGREIPKMTDEELEEVVRDMGQEVTAENIEKLRKMMEASTKLMETVEIEGNSTEFHQKISSPKLEAGDFQFELPKGAVLNQSMLDGLPDEMPAVQ